MFRRALLTLGTALIVAFPVVPSEDPGLLGELSTPRGLVLTLLWLVLAVGWAGWRLTPRRRLEGAAPQEVLPGTAAEDACHVGPVEVGLLVFVLLVAAGIWVAAYRHPAFLIAWSWLGLLVVLGIVRQLAVTRAEQRCLHAALLAAGVGLAVQALYEQGIELPRIRHLHGSDLVTLKQSWREHHPLGSSTDPAFERLRLRIEQASARATYVHPDSLAGFLILCLPGLGLAVLCYHRQGSSGWLTAVVAGLAAATACGLFLTHNLLAQVFTMILAGVLAVLLGRHALDALSRGPGDRTRFGFLGVLLAAGLCFAVWRGGLLSASWDWTRGVLRERWWDWQIAAQVIGDHPAWGVGPGSFASEATRYLPPGAPSAVESPHNFVLQIWAGSGLAALAVLLAALGAFFWSVIRAWPREETPQRGTEAGRSLALRPEFYLGGSLGLLLGFLLRIYDLDGEEILPEALQAGVRSLAWFPAFALLERLAWPAGLRLLSLVLGVAALLGCLCLADGMEAPSVAGPLWVAVGLALNSTRHRPCAWLSRRRAPRLLFLPLAAGLALFFAVLVCIPVNSSYSLQQQGLQQGRAYEARAGQGSAERRLNRVDSVLGDLREAASLDPDNARLRIHLARWYLHRWQVSPLVETIRTALEQAVAAQQLDPHGWSGYQMEYELHLYVALVVEEQLRHRPPQAEEERARKRAEARRQAREAAEVLERYVPYDPNNPVVHFLLAAAELRGDEEVEGMAHARQAWDLDQQGGPPGRRLSDPQQMQVRQWLGQRGGD